MSLGIPYMGSKRKIAKPLIDYMLNSNPNAKYFYDLFGGGGDMSFEALQRRRF
jgi:site-specific DNA-adenine methylase